MTKIFRTDDKVMFICISNVDAAVEPGTDKIQVTVRKAIIFTGSAKFINVNDAVSEQVIGRAWPQKVCESPDDAERQGYRYGVFPDMPIKDALIMAKDLGEHWQALTIDNMIVAIDSMSRQADAQALERFSELRAKNVEAMQEQLEYFRLRDIEAVAFKQPAKKSRAC